MKKRTIHTGGRVWLYAVGKGAIPIWSPDGVKHVTNLSEVSGWFWDDIERAQHKGYWEGIRPSDIKEFIESDLVGRASPLSNPVRGIQKEDFERRKRFHSDKRG